MSGRRAGDISLKKIPEGEMHGLAATPDYLAFAMRSGEESIIYLFNRHTWAITKLASFRGTIGGLAYHQGLLTAYYNEFDTYDSRWLLLIDPSRGVVKKMRFVESGPGGDRERRRTRLLHGEAGRPHRHRPVRRCLRQRTSCWPTRRSGR